MNTLSRTLDLLLPLIGKSLWRHRLSTIITAAAAALACGLVMAVFVLSAQSRAAFAGGTHGFDAVAGARGSALQLVLNSIFHLETSPGNLPWARYLALKSDPRVTLAVPYAVGDSVAGFRVVGTTPALFDALASDRDRPLHIAAGRVFDPARREAILGATVARQTGWRIGATLRPQHGVHAGVDGEEHDEDFVVVGVLESAGSPLDRVVFVPIDAVFRMTGHVLRGAGADFTAAPGEAIPAEHLEVSAVLLRLRDTQAGFELDGEFNRRSTDATLAWPIGRAVAELFDKLGFVQRILEVVAWLVVAVAASAILASLHNTLNERRRDLAILRALGARRWQIFLLIVGEAGAIATAGALGGFGVFAVIHAAAAATIRASTGIVLGAGIAHVVLIAAPLAMIALGVLAGVIPALRAYRIEAATVLADL